MRRAAAGALACVVVGGIPAAASQATPAPRLAPQIAAHGGDLGDDAREVMRLERASRDHPRGVVPSSSPAAAPAPAAPGTRPRPVRVAPHQRRPVEHHTTPAPAGSVAAVVAFALAQVGDPYRFGAEGPSGWDCSGLVAAAYAHAGVHLPHSTGGILGYGRAVGRGQLEPGDVIFPTYGHVAIYLGGGRMVEAANPRAGVRIAAVWGFATARRIL